MLHNLLTEHDQDRDMMGKSIPLNNGQQEEWLIFIVSGCSWYFWTKWRVCMCLVILMGWLIYWGRGIATRLYTILHTVDKASRTLGFLRRNMKDCTMPVKHLTYRIMVDLSSNMLRLSGIPINRSKSKTAITTLLELPDASKRCWSVI